MMYTTNIAKQKLIMVDMDGTLVYTSKANYMAYKAALRNVGFDISLNDWENNCEGKVYTDFLPKFLGFNDVLIDKVHKDKIALYPKFMKYITLNENLIELLKALKTAYYLALVTTASKKSVIKILDLFDLDELFDVIITQNDVERMKPAPDCYNLAIKKFKLKPEDCIIFEDSQAGITAAKASGASVFAVL